MGSIWGGFGYTVSNNNDAVTPACNPATTVNPECTSTGCTSPFTGEFYGIIGVCSQGTSQYVGFAYEGWKVNQSRAGGTPGTWPVPASGGITLTFTNPDNVTTRLELQDPTGTTQWCSPVQTGVQIPWGSFVTNCYTGGSPQNQIPAGQLIGAADLVVVQSTLAGGQQYNICLQNITIQ